MSYQRMFPADCVCMWLHAFNRNDNEWMRPPPLLGRILPFRHDPETLLFSFELGDEAPFLQGFR